MSAPADPAQAFRDWGAEISAQMVAKGFNPTTDSVSINWTRDPGMESIPVVRIDYFRRDENGSYHLIRSEYP